MMVINILLRAKLQNQSTDQAELKTVLVTVQHTEQHETPGVSTQFILHNKLEGR